LDAPLDRPRDEGEDRTNLIVNYLPQVHLTHPPPSNPVASLIFCMFLGQLDLLIRGQDPDPSIIEQK
jgi:hypothetical protein